jgi:hypothetical protein
MVQSWAAETCRVGLEAVEKAAEALGTIARRDDHGEERSFMTHHNFQSSLSFVPLTQETAASSDVPVHDKHKAADRMSRKPGRNQPQGYRCAFGEGSPNIILTQRTPQLSRRQAFSQVAAIRCTLSILRW